MLVQPGPGGAPHARAKGGQLEGSPLNAFKQLSFVAKLTRMIPVKFSRIQTEKVIMTSFLLLLPFILSPGQFSEESKLKVVMLLGANA